MRGNETKRADWPGLKETGRIAVVSFSRESSDPVRMIIGDVIADETTQMSVVEDDHVIEKLSATASDPAFGNPILPRNLQRLCGWVSCRWM